ncbi:MAG: DUF4112 domain-containing protein [Methylobacteriaceae bacterium]|nr:DUF4112 domain-containing protein [Methylobacteriaceae bacterium]
MASRTQLFEDIAASAPSREDSLARLDALSRLLDTAFVLPGTKFRFGVDGLIGLIPGVGDAISAVLSSYIIWEAKRLGLPRWKLARMGANVALDTAVGAVPFLGDLFDMAFKSNRRNLRIIQDHLAREGVFLRRRHAVPDVVEAEYRVVRDRT